MLLGDNKLIIFTINTRNTSTNNLVPIDEKSTDVIITV